MYEPPVYLFLSTKIVIPIPICCLKQYYDQAGQQIVASGSEGMDGLQQSRVR